MFSASDAYTDDKGIVGVKGAQHRSWRHFLGEIHTHMGAVKKEGPKNFGVYGG